MSALFVFGTSNTRHPYLLLQAHIAPKGFLIVDTQQAYALLLSPLTTLFSKSLLAVTRVIRRLLTRETTLVGDAHASYTVAVAGLAVAVFVRVVVLVGLKMTVLVTVAVVVVVPVGDSEPVVTVLVVTVVMIVVVRAVESPMVRVEVVVRVVMVPVWTMMMQYTSPSLGKSFSLLLPLPSPKE